MAEASHQVGDVLADADAKIGIDFGHAPGDLVVKHPLSDGFLISGDQDPCFDLRPEKDGEQNPDSGRC